MPEDFKQIDFSNFEKADSEKYRKDLIEAQVKRMKVLLEADSNGVLWKINSRGPFAWTLIGILIVQNLLVFGLVFAALFLDKLADLQLVLSVLVTATLAETAIGINFILKWLFKK